MKLAVLVLAACTSAAPPPEAPTPRAAPPAVAWPISVPLVRRPVKVAIHGHRHLITVDKGTSDGLTFEETPTVIINGSRYVMPGDVVVRFRPGFWSIAARVTRVDRDGNTSYLTVDKGADDGIDLDGPARITLDDKGPQIHATIVRIDKGTMILETSHRVDHPMKVRIEPP